MGPQTYLPHVEAHPGTQDDGMSTHHIRLAPHLVVTHLDYNDFVSQQQVESQCEKVGVRGEELQISDGWIAAAMNMPTATSPTKSGQLDYFHPCPDPALHCGFGSGAATQQLCRPRSPGQLCTWFLNPVSHSCRITPGSPVFEGFLCHVHYYLVGFTLSQVQVCIS